MMGVMVLMTEIDDDDHLKVLASIIEYRVINMLRTQKLMTKDIEALFLSKSKRNQDKICEDIYIKMEYLEILLSKIIDDVMSVEIIELDKMLTPSIPTECMCKIHNKEHHDNHSYQ